MSSRSSSSLPKPLFVSDFRAFSRPPNFFSSCRVKSSANSTATGDPPLRRSTLPPPEDGGANRAVAHGVLESRTSHAPSACSSGICHGETQMTPNTRIKWNCSGVTKTRLLAGLRPRRCTTAPNILAGVLRYVPSVTSCMAIRRLQSQAYFVNL
jgi:hypothetical protein